MTHSQVGQFWVSESGASITGRENAGYYAVCSCGAEVWAGPDVDYHVPQSDRLKELNSRDLNTAEQAELNRLWKYWRAEQDAKLEETNRGDHERMRQAILKHSAELQQEVSR